MCGHPFNLSNMCDKLLFQSSLTLLICFSFNTSLSDSMQAGSAHEKRKLLDIKRVFVKSIDKTKLDEKKKRKKFR